MAILPCSIHKQRYRGKAAHAYPALIYPTGHENRHHIRVCHPCMEELLEHAEPWLATQDGAELAPTPRAAACMGCSKPVDERPVQFFMTAYPDSSDREDHWGILHEDCRPPDWLEGALDNGQRDVPPDVGGGRLDRRRGL